MDIHHACLDLSYPKECISSFPWISQSIQSGRLSVPSSELVPPPPRLLSLSRKRLLLLLPLGPRRETHSIVGEGVGGPNSDEGIGTLVLYSILFCNPSTKAELRFLSIILRVLRLEVSVWIS
jgi:hypothetical protein